MDWAGLPADLLIEFAVRLTVTDWLKFSAVCAAWNRAAKTALASGRRPKPEPPWLMLAGSADPATARFFSFQDGCCRTATLPEPAIQRRIWIGSAHGWVVTADEECALHLLNPVTGSQLPLPCITTMGFFQVLPRTESGDATGFLFDERSFHAVHWPEKAFEDRRPDDQIPIAQMPLRFLRKAVPLRDPTSPGGEYLVVMIHGPMHKLAFARRRDARWVVLPSPYLFEDVLHHKGRVLSMTACGALLVWEPDGETYKSRVAVPEHGEGEEYGVYFRKYLAESLDGDLVLIWRERRSCYGGDDGEADSDSSDDDDDAEADPTVGFRVFVLRESCQGSEWKELHDLGGAALFVGYNSAVFFPADGTPNLLGDCIYFTDDNLSISWRSKQEPRDMGVFDMKNKVVTLMASVDQHSNSWPPPIWVTPSIDIVKV
ncbi:unnamed protein product [Urochloa decumbens]|uniref:KIB1-4 beta-propeller domain-containing protein n=1 Tax=Urochloa decumbens TaxID=240449 RepID=A0ABC9H991_9POAL